MAKKGGKSAEEELLNTLDDFTSEENWDKFFSIKGADDSFEWYAEWPNLKDPLLSQLSSTSLDILVPGCGNSRLSEHLYDAGFHSITNIDFSKVVISDMLRRNIRSRPQMRWRVMDMTHMQLEDEVFDAVLDKGGLDALMEPDLGHKLGAQYLLEVKRVLRTGGRFICLTLAESHVLDVLFSKFRLGWKMNIHVIPQKLSNKLQTFMVVVEKERSAVLHEITSSFDHSSLYCDKNQARGLFHALDTENKIRSEKCVDILHSLEDLQLGAEGGLEKLIPGRRLQLTLGEDGHSRFSYKAVLLDAQGQSDQFLHHCGIFLVPKIRAHEWLFSSEEGQWMIVESSKAARLVMVILDARHSLANLDDIQTDLSPLVKHLAPVTHDDSAQIPFMMAGDGIKQREIVHQVTSAMTGPIIVEDVVYENIDTSVSSSAPSKDMKFRRLTFQRSSSLVQSEAHLISEGCKNIGQMDNKKTNSILKSKKKVNRKRSTAVPLTDESRTIVVDHQYLASSYHVGIISGFMLVVSNLLSFASSEQRGKTIIVGLGAGLLPMFLHECMPFLDIEVVELDPTVLILARQYFGFIEDTQLKVHVRNGIEFVQNFASMAEPSVLSLKYQNGSASSEEKSPSNGSGVVLGPKSSRIDILIVDVDSSDSSSGLTCPHPDFVEVSFLNSVKETLSEGGLFVINLVSRSASIREKIISRIKEVFNHLYSLHLEEDVNEVIFALHTESTVTEGSFPDAAIQLEKLLKSTNLDIVQQIIDTTKKIKVL